MYWLYVGWLHFTSCRSKQKQSSPWQESEWIWQLPDDDSWARKVASPRASPEDHFVHGLYITLQYEQAKHSESAPAPPHSATPSLGNQMQKTVVQETPVSHKKSQKAWRERERAKKRGRRRLLCLLAKCTCLNVPQASLNTSTAEQTYSQTRGACWMINSLAQSMRVTYFWTVQWALPWHWRLHWSCVAIQPILRKAWRGIPLYCLKYKQESRTNNEKTQYTC